jgi:hypothetical protein
MKTTFAMTVVLIASCASPICAQCPVNDATPPATPLAYPKTSDRYAVQYRVANGAWTNATVYISDYGATDGSPYRQDSGYTLETSMSFVSIPVASNASVQMRVTKLFDTPFQPGDHVSVRPSVKPIGVVTEPDGTVQISTAIGANFDGEQFVLWWNRGSDSSGVESLAFFLNPPYTPPAPGSNVKTVYSQADLDGDLSSYDTLDFEGNVMIGPAGATAFSVPGNIYHIFLGPNSWVQGKLRFGDPDDSTQTRQIYGPGVLDGSRFDYESRACPGDQGYYALSSSHTPNALLNEFSIDGIIITDLNHAANDILFNSTVNNVKVLGWNAENAALRLGDHTTATNLFVRSGDDSLMMWGTYVTVDNATVWQNYNGGVVNLGWSDNSFGDYDKVDGLYVVKTDWLTPTASSWTAIAPAPLPAPQPLQGQNNAVFASLMVPGTTFGELQPPLFQNTFVEDPPQVLFSLKILPPICADTGMACPSVTLANNFSELNLNFENLFSPASIIENSIGFQNLPAGYTQDGQTIAATTTLSGNMSIGMTNVFIKLPEGIWIPLLGFDAASAGEIGTNGANVDVSYNLDFP